MGGILLPRTMLGFIGKVHYVLSNDNSVCCCATQSLGVPVWNPHWRYISYVGRGWIHMVHTVVLTKTCDVHVCTHLSMFVL